VSGSSGVEGGVRDSYMGNEDALSIASTVSLTRDFSDDSYVDQQLTAAGGEDEEEGGVAWDVGMVPLIKKEGHNHTCSGSDGDLVPTSRPFTLDQTVPPLSLSKVCQHWSTFLVLAAPGAASLFLEWGSFELMASLAGQLGEVSLATHGVYMSTCALLYMIPQSLAGATATLTGNHLGDNKAPEAKFVVWLGIAITCTWGLISGVILFFILRPFWGSIFTTDRDVREAVYGFMPVMFIYTIVDATKCISLNILRSTGRPGITAVGNIISCVCVMLPLGYVFSMVYSYDLYGIWGAMSFGWALATLLYLMCILTTDWEDQAALASDRNASSGGLQDGSVGMMGRGSGNDVGSKGAGSDRGRSVEMVGGSRLGLRSVAISGSESESGIEDKDEEEAEERASLLHAQRD
jgi:hypothetical protein